LGLGLGLGPTPTPTPTPRFYNKKIFNLNFNNTIIYPD